jgi:hypothetical protein
MGNVLYHFKGLKVIIVEKTSKKVLFMSVKNYTMCYDVVQQKKNGVKLGLHRG